METTATWKDIPGLTDDQKSKLAAATWMTDIDLFDIAREFAAQNRLQNSLAHIPVPAGATGVTRWHEDNDFGVERFLTATEISIGEITVAVTGYQDDTGHHEWHIQVQPDEGNYPGLDSTEARELAAALLAAATELDTLKGNN